MDVPSDDCLQILLRLRRDLRRIRDDRGRASHSEARNRAVEKRIAERSTVDILQEVFYRRRRRIREQGYINVSEIGLEPDGLGDGSRTKKRSREGKQESE